MDYEKCVCPILNVDGVMATGKQYDIEINLPEDNRTVIYGIVKDCYNEPVAEAVVKLVEVVCDCGDEDRRPVSHTFTDKNGEFVFGPLCANRLYEIEIWACKIKHCKVSTTCKHEGKCLKGIELDGFDKKDCKNDDKYDDKYDDKKDDKYDDKDFNDDKK